MTRYHVALSGKGLTGSEEPQSKKPVEGRDDAAMKAADVVAEATTGEPLSRREKTEVGGPLAHYAFGATAGAIYGAIAELTPDSKLTRGDRFGSALWVGADQLTLPLMGLSPWPLRAYPASTNFQHWTSHLVYGLTTAFTYRLIRRAIG
jgi:putative membrane protein